MPEPKDWKIFDEEDDLKSSGFGLRSPKRVSFDYGVTLSELIRLMAKWFVTPMGAMLIRLFGFVVFPDSRPKR